MQTHHRLLHRMQAAGSEVVDGDDFAAVRLPGQHDAGIDGAIHQPAVHQPPQHNRAGPAIAFGTPLLGAHRALGQSQIVQQGQRRGGIVETNQFTPAEELNVTTHDRPAPPARPKSMIRQFEPRRKEVNRAAFAYSLVAYYSYAHREFVTGI